MSSRPEFLVHSQILVPQTLDDSSRAELYRNESLCAEGLAATGHLLRAWRIPGTSSNFTLWRAKDASELHALLASLPLFPFMRCTVTALAIHQNDPCEGSNKINK